MQKVVIGSKNPVKIHAVKEAFQLMLPNEEFDFMGFAAESGVADQPMTDEETKRGAKGRIEDMKSKMPGADYYAAIEGGIDEHGGAAFTYGAVHIENKNGLVGKSTTAEVQIPRKSYELVKSGMELGHANDEVFGSENSKHSSGMTGLLTHGVLERTEFYKQAIILALVPFKNKELYEI